MYTHTDYTEGQPPLSGIILTVLRLEVFEYNVYITNRFLTTFAQTFVPITSKNSASGEGEVCTPTQGGGIHGGALRAEHGTISG
jgi:hypothetical protein